MSDTPRTDAETMRDEYDHVDTEFGAFAPSDTVGADFARQLERELNDATKERDHLKKLITDFCVNQKWAHESWKDQEHIKPLFDVFREDKKQ